MKHFNPYLFIFMLIGLANRTNAQSYNWSVLTGDSSINQDFASCISQDPSGNMIACGWFRGNIQLDPASTSAFNLSSSTASSFIAKYNSSGLLLWSKSIQGSSYVSINDVATDPSKNIYVTGTHAGTTDFDPGSGIANLISPGSSSNMFVAKYDSNGNYLWAHTCGSSGNTDAGYSIQIDHLNNVIVGGHFSGTAYFDPALSAAGQIQAISSLDAFVAKYDAQGNFQWVKGWDASKCWNVATDAIGSVYVFSEFMNSFDADPGTGVFNVTSAGDQDIFLIKLSSTGNFVWAKTTGSSSYESSGDIKYSNNSLYICGQYSDTMDMNFGSGVSLLQPLNNSNSFIAKYDTSGNLSWAKTIGDSSSVRFEAIDIAGNNDVTIAGEYNTFSPAGMDVNPGSGNYSLHTDCGVQTGLVIRLDANGNFKNAFDIENSVRMDLYDVATDNNNHVYVVGFYTDSVFIDPASSSSSAVSKGFEDIMIAKYTFDAPSQINEIQQESAITLYPNPTSNHVFVTWDQSISRPNQIILYNNIGSVMLRTQLDSSHTNRVELRLPDLTQGIYILQFVDANGSVINNMLQID